jgi:hypothetical protein
MVPAVTGFVVTRRVRVWPTGSDGHVQVSVPAAMVHPSAAASSSKSKYGQCPLLITLDW